MTCISFYDNVVSQNMKGEMKMKHYTEIAKKYKGVPVEDIPINDVWPCISQGYNKKLAKHIKVFNLPAGKSCPNCTDCYKECYAKKSEGFRKVVKKSRARNFRLAKENPGLLKKYILENVSEGNTVRIHESGDMFSQEYLDMWKEIVKSRPNTVFYTYSKTLDMWNWSKIKALSNFHVVPSIINGEKNFGPEKEIQEKARKWKLPVCPCKKGVKIVCGTECKICQTGEGDNGVLFHKH